MKIGLVRYWGRSKSFPDPRGLLGVDSMTHLCERPVLWNHIDGAEQAFDVAILVCTPEALKWFSAGRPAKWGKVLFMYCREPLRLNNPGDIEQIDRFDGLFSTFDNPAWEVFGKPVIQSLVPCLPPESPPHEPKADRVCVVVKHLNDPNVNFIDTLAIFKKTGMSGVSSTNSAAPYKDDTDKFRELAARLGLDLAITRPRDRNEYMAGIADCRVMLACDARQSYGRWVLDAAQLGIPCVGTYSTMQRLLMPDYLIHANEIERGADLVKSAKPVSVDWGQFEPSRLKRDLEASVASAKW